MRCARLVPVCGVLALAVATLPAGPAAAASKKTPTSKSGPPALAPAASGQIAFISGGTLEVRNPETGQTTVDLTAKTRITATVTVTQKAVTAGACLTATGTKAKDGALDATTVTISPASANCLARRGATGPFRARGSRTFRPPVAGGSGARSSRSFRAPANFATAFGKVTSVSGTAITIDGAMFSFSSARTRARAAAAPKPRKLSLVVSSKTRYLRTGPATAGALKVGECATAFGSTNDIGTVSATRLLVSPATATGCGFGGGAFGLGGFVRGTPGGASA